MNRYAITIKGQDIFYYSGVISVANETELCLRLASIMQHLANQTIEQFDKITIERI